MTTRTVEQVDDWESRPFSGGYRGLHDLSDDDFSGIVTAGPTRLCMTKGTVVGVLDGSIEDFEDASGTIKEAPSPALPLLAVMQARSDEVRAQYYTEETPLEEVDRTLADGNFTGYVELSENVLSGDYYQVYHQGRSMSVAYVGASDQLLTGDEAFETANDEVGIYEVRPVDIEVSEIPEPAAGTVSGGDDDELASTATDEPTPQTAAETGDATGASEPSDAEPDAGSEPAAAGDADGDDPTRATGSEPTSDAGTAAESARDDADEASSRSDDQESERDGRGAGANRRSSDDTADRGERDRRERSNERAHKSTGANSRQDEPRASTGGTARQEEPRSSTGGTARQGSPDPRGSSRREENQTRSRRTADASRSHPSPESREDTTGADGSPGGRGSRSEPASRQSEPAGHKRSSEEVADLETRSIPSLDPERTVAPTSGSTSSSDGAGQSQSVPPRDQSQTGAQSGPGPAQAQPQSSGSGTTGRSPAEAPPENTPPGEAREDTEPTSQPSQPPGDAQAEGASADLERLESELADREAEIDRLESELETVEGERDELEAERDELQEQVERLEQRVNELRTEEGGESIADRERMTPGEAIEATNLFVRYRSKGDATLEDAHGGRAEAEAVNDNLEIQHHTQFEAEDVAVSGEPFEEFLDGTLQYKFVEWIVRDLLYEIRDTGHQDALKDLYNAIPEIDRAELNGSISVLYVEDGQETRSQERFDVVLRDRMGNPLAVANLNEARDPASQSEMESLITAAQRVGESKETLAGGFLVTSSFFEPGAMEAAADATGSGLLSRDKRESFVKLSRKDGFHLCLVEAREEQFNLSVPEI